MWVSLSFIVSNSSIVISIVETISVAVIILEFVYIAASNVVVDTLFTADVSINYFSWCAIIPFSLSV
jgi:hypothetical protein